MTDQPRTYCITDANGHFRLNATHNFHLAIIGASEGVDWPRGHNYDRVTVSHPDYFPGEFGVWAQGDLFLEPRK